MGVGDWVVSVLEISWCVNKGGVGVGDRVVSVLEVSWCVNKGGVGVGDRVVLLLVLLLVGDKGGAGGCGQGWCWWLGTRVVLVVGTRVMLVLLMVGDKDGAGVGVGGYKGDVGGWLRDQRPRTL